jgi:hypothetical protein
MLVARPSTYWSRTLRRLRGRFNFSTLTLHSNHGNMGSTHFVSRKIRIAIKTVLAGH